MRLRIFPREESFFDLFEAAADNMAESARLLDDLVEDFVDPELKAKRLVEHEHEGDRITHAILTRLNSTFITPASDGLAEQSLVPVWAASRCRTWDRCGAAGGGGRLLGSVLASAAGWGWIPQRIAARYGGARDPGHRCHRHHWLGAGAAAR
jgi:Protein of unknown function DUF47